MGRFTLTDFPREILLEISEMSDFSTQDCKSLRLVHPLLNDIFMPKILGTTRVPLSALSPEGYVEHANVLKLIFDPAEEKLRNLTHTLRIEAVEEKDVRLHQTQVTCSTVKDGDEENGILMKDESTLHLPMIKRLLDSFPNLTGVCIRAARDIAGERILGFIFEELGELARTSRWSLHIAVEKLKYTMDFCAQWDRPYFLTTISYVSSLTLHGNCTLKKVDLEIAESIANAIVSSPKIEELTVCISNGGDGEDADEDYGPRMSKIFLTDHHLLQRVLEIENGTGGGGGGTREDDEEVFYFYCFWRKLMENAGRLQVLRFHTNMLWNDRDARRRRMVVESFDSSETDESAALSGDELLDLQETDESASSSDCDEDTNDPPHTSQSTGNPTPQTNNNNNNNNNNNPVYHLYRISDDMLNSLQELCIYRHHRSQINDSYFWTALMESESWLPKIVAPYLNDDLVDYLCEPDLPTVLTHLEIYGIDVPEEYTDAEYTVATPGIFGEAAVANVGKSLIEFVLLPYPKEAFPYRVGDYLVEILEKHDAEVVTDNIKDVLVALTPWSLSVWMHNSGFSNLEKLVAYDVIVEGSDFGPGRIVNMLMEASAWPKLMSFQLHVLADHECGGLDIARDFELFVHCARYTANRTFKVGAELIIEIAIIDNNLCPRKGERLEYFFSNRKWHRRVRIQ